jgi:Signal transduction histidine kinase
MRYIRNKLSRQLLVIVFIIFSIVLIAFGIVLPGFLTPLYENNVYNSLKYPLEVLPEDISNMDVSNGISYIKIVGNDIKTSSNIKNIISIDVSDVIKHTNGNRGKFIYKNKFYYYYVIKDDFSTKIAITNNTYTGQGRFGMLGLLFPTLFASFLLVSLIALAWSSVVVRKIGKLKLKIDNIDNDNFNHKLEFYNDDEINSLALALEDMRISLKNQEKYKNDMYQNISHDFKTPLTVIKSYIEAVDDGVEDVNSALKVIGNQTDKLEKKVHALLYLNKLDYLKNIKTETTGEVNIKEIIESSVEKFKYQRTDVKFNTKIDDSIFIGTVDLWETIIDNILGNFMRYADSEVSITVKGGKILLYNDGPIIDDEIISTMFNPYKKGIKGEFGLGLSIVKKTLNLLKYDILIRNKKKGVLFTIQKD